MRVLIDALPAEFGGIRTYADHVVGAWPTAAPDDEVHVALAADSGIPVPDGVIEHRLALGSPRSLGRAVAQTRHLPELTRRLRPDVVLATLPSTTVVPLRAPMIEVVYDLRHELRPEQFSRAQRTLRRVSYARGYRLADGFAAISQRTLDDLHRLHPRTRAVPATVAHLGADHADAWPTEPTGPTASGGPAITFAHHSNKNLDLVLDGWAGVVARHGDRARLLVLGVAGERRSALVVELESRGLAQHVEVAPFLPDDAFQAAISAASLVVFPSDFEGFGLPIVEAMRRRIPVVIGPDPACREVAGGHAFEMASFTAAELTRACAAGLSATAAQREAAWEYARRFTWERTVQRTRELMSTVLA